MQTNYNVFPIQWQEGDVLTTQLLQENSMFPFRTNNLLYNNTNIGLNWGISELEINDVDLEKGILRINKISAIFPNGVIFNYDNNWSLVNTIYEMSTIEEKKIYEICLNLTEYNDFFQGENDVLFAIQLIKNGEYYESQTLVNQHRDVMNSDQIDYVPRSIFLAKIVPYEDALNMSLTLPFIKICNSGAGYSVKEYEVPRMIVNKDTNLYNIINKFLSSITNKLSLIRKEYKLQKQHDIVTAERYYTLYIIIGHLYALNSYLSIGRVHPYDFFLELLKILSVLKFSGNTQIQNYQYQHTDLIFSFNNLITDTNNLINILYVVKDNEIFVQKGDFLVADVEFNESDFQSNMKEVAIEFIFFDLERIHGQHWIESTIICLENQLETVKFSRFVGFDRKYISSTIEDDNKIILKYSVQIPMENLTKKKMKK